MRERTTHRTGNVSHNRHTPRKQGGAALDEKIGEQESEKKTGILDSGATSGAAPEEDEEHFEDSGKKSSKVFMLLDKCTHRATKKMLLKHNLREEAREINIVPGLHSTLISVPKLADANYVTILDKNEAKIYDMTTTNVSTTQPPVLTAPRCEETGLWKIQLDPNKPPNITDGNMTPTTPPDAINAVFDLPSSRQTLLWQHASLGFPPKETLITAVQAGQPLDMAQPHRHHSTASIPRFHRNGKGTPEGTAAGNTFNKTKGFGQTG